MAKNPTAAELRYGTVSRDDVQAFADVIRESATDLKEVADQMNAAGIRSMKMDGRQKFPRGQKLISEFVGRLEEAVARARADIRLARQQKEIGESK